ncbi:HAMP domain-containing histidine kinase [Mucilaginibacter sp. 14171R-50]|uniref:sensor histidine kinase n=1 Tax=Mucilaginibacter sp. 14171R-50 TaxID=2703789 RepID=UPI00138CC2E6|nr:HAMP domain-containing sensor histidine kinase [Mucilaginibacter sp. 14171R-50]QHS56772.1 HAMP domain-containing histidine kinase [Mucilaginibacter sp. 14171R-50]
MKTKLKIVFVLAAVALAGVILFQAYWSFNAFKLNKQRFDDDIDVVMQRALDSCKKDYFDSVRVVMVRRLSDPGTHIKIDTIMGRDTAHVALQITIKNKYTGLGEPYSTTVPVYDYYRQKIDHKATVPEVLTEMSFYVPHLRDELLLLLGMEDAMKSNTGNQGLHNGIFELPENYRRADSIKLYEYYSRELDKLHPRAEFELHFSDKPIAATVTSVPKPFSMLWHSSPQPAAITSAQTNHANELMYSETEQYDYKYHGFLFLQHNEKNTLYVRAVFDRAQVGVLKEMILPLLLSGLLIVFTIFCFYYIIRTMVRQKKLTALKDDFINNMTHELKTPIATITVAIEGLQKYNAFSDPEKTQRYLQTSRNELARLNDLVSKVLNVAAFESKQINLHKEQVQIDRLIDDVISSEKLKAGKKVDISYNNPEGIITIVADMTHLRNVMTNIIDNAIKYSDEPAEVKINLSSHNGKAVFSIKDNGIGIPAAHVRHIFDKFHRVPAGNVHNVKGTGLGLNYVKYIVHAHGGSIRVKSQQGTGSEFIITLPLKNG